MLEKISQTNTITPSIIKSEQQIIEETDDEIDKKGIVMMNSTKTFIFKIEMSLTINIVIQKAIQQAGKLGKLINFKFGSGREEHEQKEKAVDE